jgi:hypothetical protein
MSVVHPDPPATDPYGNPGISSTGRYTDSLPLSRAQTLQSLEEPLNPPASPQPKGDYNYDPFSITYEPMTISDWSSVPSDQSDFSYLWSSPEAFTPANFSKHLTEHVKVNGISWIVIFLLNLAVTCGLCVWIALRYRYQSHKITSGFLHDIPERKLFNIIGIGVGFAIGGNLVNFCFATCIPSVYVTWGGGISIVLAIAMCIPAILRITVGDAGWWLLLFYMMVILIMLIFVFTSYDFYSLRAALVKIAMNIIFQYSSIFILVILLCALELVIALGFFIIGYYISVLGMSIFLYIYVIFSYLWIANTVAHVFLVACSGVASSWYFLADTASPVWTSFKRAAKTSIGSAAHCALLAGIAEWFRQLVYGRQPLGSSCMRAMRCCGRGLICVFGSCLKYVNSDGLIYCGIYGIPYFEGGRRWAENLCKRFVQVFTDGVSIHVPLMTHACAFVVGPGALALAISYSDPDYGHVALPVVTLMFSLGIFWIVEKPILGYSDTILVCFIESHTQLRSSAPEMHEMLVAFYGPAVEKRIAFYGPPAEK